MDTLANTIIDTLGGTSAVARLAELPTSTVHSWRKNGIPASRFAHLKLAAAANGHDVNLDALVASEAAPQPGAPLPFPDRSGGKIDQEAA